MAARRAAAAFAAIALCVIASVAAQGPAQTPLDVSNCGATIAGTVRVTGGLTQLSNLLGNVSTQIPTLTASGKSVTLFAPSDSAIGAFQAALNGAHPTMSQAKMQQLLAQMVRYHMLPTPVNTANMTVGSELKTSLSGHKITITATSPQVKLEGQAPGSEARIGQPNIVICKSLMHIIDSVLLPAPIADVAAGMVTSVDSSASAAAAAPSTAAPSAAALASAASAKRTTTPKPSKSSKSPTKKALKPTATAAAAKPGLPAAAAARKSKTDTTIAKASTNKTTAGVAPAPAPGAASHGSAAGALCLMAAAVAATLLLG